MKRRRGRESHSSRKGNGRVLRTKGDLRRAGLKQRILAFYANFSKDICISIGSWTFRTHLDSTGGLFASIQEMKGCSTQVSIFPPLIIMIVVMLYLFRHCVTVKRGNSFSTGIETLNSQKRLYFIRLKMVNCFKSQSHLHINYNNTAGRCFVFEGCIMIVCRNNWRFKINVKQLTRPQILANVCISTMYVCTLSSLLLLKTCLLFLQLVIIYDCNERNQYLVQRNGITWSTREWQSQQTTNQIMHRWL